MDYPQSKTIPWDHQKEAWNLSHDKKAFYYAMGMGCVSANTTIKVSRANISYKIPIRELYKWFHNIQRTVRWNPELPIHAKCFDGKTIRHHKINDVVYSGKKFTLKLTLATKQFIVLTPDHLVLAASREWRQAQDLKPGDIILIHASRIWAPSIGTVAKIEPYKEIDTYDLVMEEPYHNFVANDIIVHNSGKSKVTVDYCNGIDAKNVLIICPKSGIRVWPKQFGLHSRHEYKIIGHQFKKSASTKKKTELIQAFIKNCIAQQSRYAVVLNYESFWLPPLGPIYKKFTMIHPGLLMSIPWDLMVCDEIHRIKSPNGKASWGAARVGKAAKRRLGLSGTPMPHSESDIYAQYRFLDQSIFGNSFTRFKAQFCVMGGFENRQIVSIKNRDELSKRFYSIAYRVKTEDVINLPDERHEVLNCELSPKAYKIYRELEKEFVTEIENQKITVDNALVKLLRLSQFASGFYQDGPDSPVKVIDSAKMELFEDKLSDLPVDEPVVVFCRFTAEVRMAKEIVLKLGRTCGELSGRENDMDDWDAGKIDTMVIQIKSGSDAIDLTRACYSFYLSTGTSAGTLMQSFARVRRPGQARFVRYYHFHTLGTVDVSIYKTINRRISAVEKTLSTHKNSIYQSKSENEITIADVVNDIVDRLGSSFMEDDYY